MAKNKFNGSLKDALRKEGARRVRKLLESKGRKTFIDPFTGKRTKLKSLPR